MNIATVTPLPDREPIISIIDVTPAMAQIWLGHNTANRTLKAHAVRAYAQDMAAGRWALNGESIKFTGTMEHPGKLLDGQNRLHAVLKADATVRMIVAFGIPDVTQITMDSGAKRTVADNLQINGRSNVVVVAAAANIALHVQANRLAGGARFTNPTIQAFIDENPGIEMSAELVHGYARRSDVPPAMVVYTHFVFSAFSLEAATAFWRDAAEKAGLVAGDPVIALTNRFAEARRNRETLPRTAQLSMIYRAWNARCDGKAVRLIKINSVRGGLIDIPELRGPKVGLS